jgi:hypothetical protein
MAAFGWIAFAVAANGLISLATGLEVVPEGSAGPLAEPVGVAVAAVALAFATGFSTGRSVLLPLETALIAAAALILVTAFVGVLFGGAGAGFITLGRAATSVFTLADVLLAAVAGLIVLLVVRGRAAGAGSPRWPWEDDERP